MNILIFLSVLTTLVTYMTVPFAGFIVFLTLGLIVAQTKRMSPLEKLAILLIASMPFYMTPILPGLHFLASWTTVLLVLITLYLASKVKQTTPGVVLALLLFVSTPFLSDGWASGPVAASYYSVQLALFAFPLSTVYFARSWVAQNLPPVGRERILGGLIGTLMAMAIAVIIQWALYTFFGISIGSISSFLQRTSFDILIPAFSVTSALLGIGTALAGSLWRGHRRLQAVALVVISNIAIIVNSSRIGLISGFLALTVSLFFPPRGFPRASSRLAIFPALCLGAVFASELLTQGGRGGIGLLDDNGRFETYINGLEQLARDPLVTLIGEGYTSGETMAPHNFFLETLVRSGIPAGLCILILTAGILFYLRGSEWIYPCIGLLIASMAFTGFYAVKAAAAIAVVMVILKAADPDGAISPPFYEAATHRGVRLAASKPTTVNTRTH